MATDRIVIRAPDDFHLHLRDGDMMKLVAPETAKVFRRALVMPNVPEVLHAGHALTYRDDIVEALFDPVELAFEPLMTIKLTHATSGFDISNAKELGVLAAKLYPAGVTTGSHGGIKDVQKLAPVFEAMEKCGMVLCVHGEAPGAFIMDREEAYFEDVDRIHRQFPGLKIVLEHISTSDAVDYVARHGDNVAATITPMHLYGTLDLVLAGGLKPHNFCYPVLKRPYDQRALIRAATGQLHHEDLVNRRFFAGTDSAPHYRAAKEAACGCAGCFSAPVAMSVYAQVFEATGRADWLHRLECFTSRNGADFYGLPRNKDTLTLTREEWEVPLVYPRLAVDAAYGVVPFLAGEKLAWRAARDLGKEIGPE